MPIHTDAIFPEVHKRDAMHALSTTTLHTLQVETLH
jgi:hypothetical protein